MSLEDQIINYIDKVVEDHPEIPSYILQTTAHETISFFLEQDNIERALLEAQNLKKYLIKLTKK